MHFFLLRQADETTFVSILQSFFCFLFFAFHWQVREGKMVLELRPRIDWNKGSAVHWILSVLGLLENNSNGGGGGHTAVPPMQQMQQHEGKSASEEAAVAPLASSKSGLSRSGAPAFSLEHTRPQQRLRQDVVAFYLGDDITDEDAFLALKRLSCSSSWAPWCSCAVTSNQGTEFDSQKGKRVSKR